MALRSQQQVMVENDRMAGRAMGAAMPAYGAAVGGELIAAIESAKSPEGLLKRLNPAMLRRMKTEKLEAAIAHTQVIGGLAGRTAALPGEATKERGEEATKERGEEATKRRSDGATKGRREEATKGRSDEGAEGRSGA